MTLCLTRWKRWLEMALWPHLAGRSAATKAADCDVAELLDHLRSLLAFCAQLSLGNTYPPAGVESKGTEPATAGAAETGALGTALWPREPFLALSLKRPNSMKPGEQNAVTMGESMGAEVQSGDNLGGWRAGHRIKSRMLNELSRQSLGSLGGGAGGFVVDPTLAAAAGRPGAVPFAVPVSFSATSGAPQGRPRPSGRAGGRGGARRPRAGRERGGSRWRAGWRRRWGCHGSASPARAPAPTSAALLACPRCLPDFGLCGRPRLTSLPSLSAGAWGIQPSGVPGPMQCRLLRGLAGALLTLLCMGLLSVRYHSRGSPQAVREAPRRRPPSPLSPELQPDDVFIAIKTTRAFHHSRLELLLDTWVSRTREQVTDEGAAVGPKRGP